MNWRRRKPLERELDREIAFHIEQHTADLIEQGHAPEEAARQARLQLGGPEQVKEACRDARGARWLDDSLHDLRYAFRSFRRNG